MIQSQTMWFLLRFCVFLPIFFPLSATGQTTDLKQEIQVERTLLDVRVLDRSGVPIPHLELNNFQLVIKGEQVPIISCYWNQASDPKMADNFEAKKEASRSQPLLPESKPEEPIEEEAEIYGTALNVVLIQGEVGGNRKPDLVRAAFHGKRMLNDLPGNAYTAVFSFHSHLQLKCDFTKDRDLLNQAVDAGIRTGNATFYKGTAYPSLAPYFDAQRGKEVAFIEDAFFEIAQTLSHFKGSKNILFIGWGVGRMNVLGAHQTLDYDRARDALIDARASVFGLDLTLADYHSLELGMKILSEETGGTYRKLVHHPEIATDFMLKTLSGYYTLSFEIPSHLKDAAKRKLTLINVPGGYVYAPRPY